MTGAMMKMMEPEIRKRETKANVNSLLFDAGWAEADAFERAAKNYDVSVE